MNHRVPAGSGYRREITTLLGMLGLMAALGPVVVHDSRETSPLGSAGERPGTFAAAPVVYERRAGDWQQWWLAFARNDQDRGIVRTGRHAGDWELLQVRLDRPRAAGRGGVRAALRRRALPVGGGREARRAAGRLPRQRLPRGVLPPRRARPHVAGPERRGGRAWRGGRPGGRAARGLGAPARPVGRRAAGWVPGEMDSPRGPRFQPQGRWSDPEAWARAARPCTYDRCDEAGECDGRETVLALGALLVLAVAAGGLLRRRSSRHTEHREP